MKKPTVNFVCQECGYDSPQWLGKCPECGSWNSLREIKTSGGSSRRSTNDKNIEPKKLSEISLEEKNRIKTGFSEFDNVLGGGMVKGGVVLVAGDPGVGKSTLLLQIALFSKNKTLYISGEESETQIKMRAKRIQEECPQDMLVLSISDTDIAVSVIEKEKPDLVIIDSIQTMESENVSGLSGSVPQIRYAASQFIKTAKIFGIPTILVGHVTKEGFVAGPMLLSHMVDTVLFLEGEKLTKTRILRSLKNRFGSLDEVGVFTMDEKGMRQMEESSFVLNAQDKTAKTVGNIFVIILEGKRPFLVEIQALVVASRLPLPRRVASGIDYKRLELLLAILQKHCRLPLGTSDVFVNVAGGIKIADPAADLGICLAILSSFKNISLSNTVAIGEVGLLGELREVQFLDKRIKEGQKLGFKQIISSKEYKALSQVVKLV